MHYAITEFINPTLGLHGQNRVTHGARLYTLQQSSPAHLPRFAAPIGATDHLMEVVQNGAVVHIETVD